MQDTRQINCDQDFVRIHHVRPILQDRFSDAKQRLFFEQVIVIQQNHEVARDHVERAI